MNAFRYVVDMSDDNAPRVLGRLLAALVALDVDYLRGNPRTPLLYAAGVRYEQEEGDREDWLDVPNVLARRRGDCEDLACWRVAELRVAGETGARVCFRRMIHKNGLSLFHVYVKRANGTREDPSARLGMPGGVA